MTLPGCYHRHDTFTSRRCFSERDKGQSKTTVDLASPRGVHLVGSVQCLKNSFGLPLPVLLGLQSIVLAANFYAVTSQICPKGSSSLELSADDGHRVSFGLAWCRP